MHKGLPTSKGLYDSRYEHDACGVGLLVNIKGVKSHQLVEKDCRCLSTWSTEVPKAPTPRPATEPA